jgi:melibiose permease/lactose/raffinose/galactose permease
MKFSMLILPLFFIAAGYMVYRLKYRIDKEMFDKIVDDLVIRGDFRRQE